MRKIITTISTFLLVALAALAQDDAATINALEQRADSLQRELDKVEVANMNKIIWGKGRFTRLGYAKAQTAADLEPIENSQWAFFFTKGTTYLFPGKPIAGLLKVGFDVVWFDVQVSKYKSAYDNNQGWTSEFDESAGIYDEDSFDLNIGCLGLNLGMGIGPNVSVAPFALSSAKILKPLRVSFYFHYAPTATLYFRSQDGDTEVSSAFCNMMRFGGTLSYRKIGVGLEGFWGKSKFKPLDFESLFDDEANGSGSEKYTRKFANLRMYVQFTF